MALCAYAVANTTIAYLGAPWALTLLGITPTAHAIVITGAILVLVCSLVNAIGVDALKGALRLGVAAEAIASVGIGLALLLVFREQSPSALFDTFGAEALSGGSTFAALLAALAVAGWAFIGFDSTVAAAEETKGAAKHVPRAVWIALLSVGALVILNAFATTLAHPNPADVAAGKDIDPVSTAVVASLRRLVEQAVRGRRAARVRRLRHGRAGRDVARDLLRRPRRRAARLALPAQGRPPPGADRRHRRDHARSPGLGLLLGLEATAIGSLITFGTAAIYCAFLLIAIAALYGRSQGVLSRARARIVLNVLAVAWLAFETVNVAWPRDVARPARRALVPGVGRADGRRARSPSSGSPISFGAKPTMAAELAIVDARVRTLDPARPFATRGGDPRRDDRRASATTCASTCDARTEVIDARGAALVPGLVDSHMHPFWGAELARGVDLSGLRDAGRGARGAGRASAPQRGWLFAWGLDYDARADARGDRATAVGGARGVRAALRPAHARWPRRARSSSRRSRARVDFPDGSEVVCVDGVPTGELHEPGAQDLVLRAAPRLRWPELRARHVDAAAAAERARADRRARDGRRAGDATTCCATSRAPSELTHAPARAAVGHSPTRATRSMEALAGAARRARAAVARRRRRSSSPTA